MKHAFPSKFLVALSVLAIFAGASGCKLPSKKDRDAQKEAEAEQKKRDEAAAQEQKQKQKEQAAALKTQSEEEHRLARASQQLLDKIQTFSALAGNYEGTYPVIDNKLVAVKITISVANLPPAAAPDHALKESELLAQAEAISLVASVDERWVGEHSAYSADRIMSCQAANIKPDLATGTIRIGCEASGSNPGRYYVLNLDSIDTDFATTTKPDLIALRSKAVADELVQHRIHSVDALSALIRSPYIDFNAKLKRKAPVVPAPASE